MPSACFQGVDTLRIASKHAEGMSLRYDDRQIRHTPPLISLSYAAISVYRANIQCAVTAATSPPQKCAMMALGVRSR